MPLPAPEFVPLPLLEPLRITWPTPNQALFDEPDRYFARTAANPNYGRPGWTRDCGNRLHLGCDIAPVEKTATGDSTMVEFTDCETGRDYEGQTEEYVERIAIPDTGPCEKQVVQGTRDPD